MFIDTNIFIDAFIGKDKKSKNSWKFIERIINGEQHACTSPLVFNEILFVLINLKGEKFAKKIWKNIKRIPNLEILKIDTEVLNCVLRFVDDGLEVTDAFHAATMYANGITTICSYDKHFDNIKGIKRQEPK